MKALLLILGSTATAIGMSFLLESNWNAASALFNLAILLFILILVTRRDRNL